MRNSSKKVAIIGGVRIPFVKSFTNYSESSNKDMLTHVLANLVERNGLKGEQIGDVAFGAVMTHSADWNLTREVVLGSGLNPDTPGFNVQPHAARALIRRTSSHSKSPLGKLTSALPVALTQTAIFP